MTLRPRRQRQPSQHRHHQLAGQPQFTALGRSDSDARTSSATGCECSTTGNATEYRAALDRGQLSEDSGQSTISRGQQIRDWHLAKDMRVTEGGFQ